MKIIIETHRLQLREMNVEDAPFLFELNNDSDVLKYTGDVPFVNEEEAWNFLVNYDQYKKYNRGRWAVIIKSTNDFAGWCGLKYRSEDNETDLGFRFMKKFWNQGLASEAALACINYGFSILHLNRIVGRAMIENKASIRVLEKVGMKFDKPITLSNQKAALFTISNK